MLNAFCKLLGRIGGLLTVTAAFCGGGFAQNNFRFDSWTTDNGLPQNSVTSIRQTRDGYIWLTTLDGLARFDGVRFTVFNKGNTPTLPSNRLQNLVVDEDGSLWMLTEMGEVLRFRKGVFQALSTADGLPSETVFRIDRAPDGAIYAFSNAGLVRFTGERFAPVEGYETRDMRNVQLYFSPRGDFWEMDATTLTRKKDGRTDVYRLPVDLSKSGNSFHKNEYVIRMLEDRDGALWIFAWWNVFYKFVDGRFEIIDGTKLQSDIVRVFIQDAGGTIWFGTERHGVCRIVGGEPECFDRAGGFSSDHVRDLLVDREGTLWIATDDNGFTRLTNRIVTPLSVAAGLREKNVYSVFEDESGAVWIGSSRGLARYENGKIANYGPADGLRHAYVNALCRGRDGKLWIGSLNGLMYLENGRFHAFSNDVWKTYFDTYDIHRDRRGALWFGTTNGLIRYENQKTEILTEQDGLPARAARKILEARDGSFWIGTAEGLAHLADGRITAYTEKDGLGGKQIRALYEDEDGTLWIGTYDSGLTRFRDGRFAVIKQENGLYSNGVFEILPDGTGHFWITSNQGIYRVGRDQLNDFADGKTPAVNSAAFGKSDGMLNNECNGGGSPAGIRTRDGKLWFPTQDGVAIVDPEKVTFNPLPPPVALEQVLIENKAPADLSPGIVIEPGQNAFEISYTGLSFIKPEQIRFRYRLEGLDENWTEAGLRRTAFFSYLPPGDYTFRVIAANSDNVWNETGASIRVRVNPPFYRTRTFIAAAAAVVLALVYGAYRLRVGRLKKAQRMQEEFSRHLINAHETERRRIAAELHDSIGQSLAMIKNRAVFATQKVEDETARGQFEIITEQTAQTIGEVREISYNLRPYLLDRLGLTQAVKSLINKVSETHGLEIETDVDDVDELFPNESEMSIYRIVQECLNNIVRHSAATKAVVSIKRGTQRLRIAIEDNGKGFDPGAPPPHRDVRGGGFGLLGLTERVRMLKGAHRIESAAGAGTKIVININFDEARKNENERNN